MTTKAIQDCVCPICGQIGQLQQYIPNPNRGGKAVFYRVGHFKNKKGKLVKRLPMHRMNKKYAYQCYIGKYVVLMGYEVLLPHQVLYAYAERMGENKLV